MSSRRADRRGSAILTLTFCAGVFLLSFAYRALSPKLTDDDFLFLSRGRQILQYGDLPCRDFLDEGRPLQYVASAAGLAIFGDRLLGEIAIDVTLLALASALTVWLAARLSGSAIAGLLAGLLVMLLAPRLYNYPKYALPVIGLMLLWRYAEAKRSRALAAAALFTAFAFVFRHDFGGYLGAAGAVTIAVAHWGDGLRVALRQVARFAAVAAIGVAPYLVYLQVYEGVFEHFRASWRFTNREFQREWRRPGFTIDRAKPWLTVERAAGPPLPKIRVRWASSVDDVFRGALERRYRLTAPRLEEGRTWEYDLPDQSTATLGALVRDEHVEDTHNIDRVSFQIVRMPVEPPGARLRRWIPLLRLRAPAFASPLNAFVWLYYLAILLPAAAIMVVTWRQLARGESVGAAAGETAKVLGLAALCGLSGMVLLRDSLVTSDRLTEVGPPLGVLGAWLSVVLLRGGQARAVASRLAGWTRVAVVSTVVLATMISIVIVGRAGRRIENVGLTEGWAGIARQARLTSSELLASPPIDGWVAEDAVGLRTLARYVAECTTPRDTLLVTWFAPQAHFYSGRGFAGGQPFFLPGFWAREDDQRASIARMRAERVPIAIVNASPYEGTTRAAVFKRSFPLVAAHVRERYTTVTESSFGGPGGVRYRVLVDSRLTPTGVYAPLHLPCFK